MPPIIGAAMGFMISEPVPVESIIGINPIRVVKTVISFGRKRRTAPSRTDFSISARFIP